MLVLERLDPPEIGSSVGSAVWVGSVSSVGARDTVGWTVARGIAVAVAVGTTF